MKLFIFPKKVHFGGGAWAIVNFVGVAKRLYEKWEEVKKENPEIYKGELCDYTRFSGDSAGAVIACGLALGLSIETMKKSYIDMAKRGRIEGVLWGKITKHHDKMLDDLLSQRKNTLELLHKREFHFGITKFFGKYHCCKKWRNLDHLRECLHSGFYLPFYCEYKTGICLDGGFSNNNERMKTYNLTIGIGEAWDISINPELMEIIFPPPSVTIDQKIVEGYNDTIIWEKNYDAGVLSCTKSDGMKPYGKMLFVFIYLLKFLHFMQNKTFMWITKIYMRCKDLYG